MEKTINFLAKTFGITENPNTKELEMCLTPEKIRLIGTFAEMVRDPKKISKLNGKKIKKFQTEIERINLHAYETFIVAVSKGLIKMANEICDIRKTGEFTVAEVELAESCLITGVEYDFIDWQDIDLNNKESLANIIVWLKDHLEKLVASEKQEARASQKQSKGMEETFDGGLYSKEAVENTFGEEAAESVWDEQDKDNNVCDCSYFITIPFSTPR